MGDPTKDDLISFNWESPFSFGLSALNSTLDFNFSVRAQPGISTPARVSAEYRPTNLDGGSTRVNVTVAEANLRKVAGAEIRVRTTIDEEDRVTTDYGVVGNYALAGGRLPVSVFFGAFSDHDTAFWTCPGFVESV